MENNHGLQNIKIGKTGVAKTTVSDSNTAKAVWSGSLDVFATPMMIALMESAACECLADCMDTGQTSVGNMINVEHTKASPIGAEIKASATIESVNGRKIVFTVAANDDSGEIGKGRHERTIIDAERFMSKLEKTGG